MNSYYSGSSVLFLTPWVKRILLFTLAFWFLGQIILESIVGIPLTKWLALQPNLVLHKFFFWQSFSYLFLHSVGQWSHLLFNMLMLWLLGSFLEQQWGSRFFACYYFASGIGAAWFHVLVLWIYSHFTQQPMGVAGLSIPVIGSSGAIFGLILAYGWLFGNRVVHFMLIFPMKARYFAMILAAIQIVGLLSMNTNSGGKSSNVAYLVHLGGFVSGFLFLFFYVFFKGRLTPLFSWFHQWRGDFSKKKRNLRLVVVNDKKKGNSQHYH